LPGRPALANRKGENSASTCSWNDVKVREGSGRTCKNGEQKKGQSAEAEARRTSKNLDWGKRKIEVHVITIEIQAFQGKSKRAASQEKRDARRLILGDFYLTCRHGLVRGEATRVSTTDCEM